MTVIHHPRRTRSTTLAALAAVAAFGVTAGTASADDGLTHAQAAKARSAALDRVPGRAVDIDRDVEKGVVTYSVDVLTRAGATRDVHLSAAFRVTSVRSDRTEPGLTYAVAGRAAEAATARVPGIATTVDVEDDGPTRYEVTVLRTNGSEVEVALDRGFKVVSTRTESDDD